MIVRQPDLFRNRPTCFHIVRAGTARALRRGMDNDLAQAAVPPLSHSLFPHEQFPAYRALLDAVVLLDATLARRPEALPHAERLRIHLHDLSIRLIVAARGSSSLPRWYRRIIAASRRCAQAQGLVDALALRRLLTTDEAQPIAEALERVVEALDELLLRDDLPDRARVSLALGLADDEAG